MLFENNEDRISIFLVGNENKIISFFPELWIKSSAQEELPYIPYLLNVKHDEY